MRLRHFIAIALLLAPLSLTQAEERHVTDIKEKHELIAKRRPAERDVKGAQGIVDKLKPDQARVYNAMRILGQGDVRLREDPYVHGRVGLPPLGELEANADNQADSWVLLRLLALLRAGYPAEPGMQRELAAWLQSARPLRQHEWADVSLELLTLQAVTQREDRGLESVRETAIKRAQEIVASREWSRPTPEDPSLHVITNQLHYLIARRAAVANSWGEVDAECAAQIVAQLQDSLDDARKKPLWIEVPEKQDAVYYRALMIMAALLGTVIEDESLEKSVRRDAEKAMNRIKERLPEKPADQDGWRCFKGDAIVLALTTGEELGRRQIRALRDDAAELGLGRCRYVFGLPRPHNSHIAAGLRWVLCRSFGDPGMGRGVVELEYRDTAAALCMALIATTGGLFDPPAEPLDWGEAVTVFRALETLDLDDYYGYMLKTDLAIDASAQWLLSKQDNDGLFMGQYRAVLGGHALAVHALLDAGVPRDHPQVKKAWAEFLKMVEECLPGAARGDGSGMVAFGRANYSCSIALMTWQSYYEAEIRASGMYEATTFEAYHKARAKLWAKIPEREKELIADISWRLSNADGYGWSYQLPEIKTPIPGPITTEPDRKDKEESGPVTGEKAEKKQEPREVADERQRRTREGKFPPRPEAPEQGVRHGDNSNSQYSVLGLKAAMTLGAPMDVKTLAWEAERLMGGFLSHGFAERLVNPTRLMTLEQLEQRSKDPRYADEDVNNARLRPTLQPYPIGGWSYFANGAHTWGATENDIIGTDDDGNPIYSWPYSVAMTAAGVSSLAIIRDALMIAEVYDPQLIARVDDYIAGGVYGLGLKYPYNREYFKIDATQTECWIGGGEGRGMMYDMYSCERAGVLTGKVYLANTEWYRDGADLLMSEQNRQGGWTALDEQVCNASWAILFLKRSAPYLATQRPPQRTGPVTGK